jgi:hypothetical protein
LAGGVKHVKESNLIVDGDLLAIRIYKSSVIKAARETKLMLARTFDGGVVLVDEVALNELDSQGRLTNTWEKKFRLQGEAVNIGQGAHQLASAPYDNQLVLSEELGLEEVSCRQPHGADKFQRDRYSLSTW